jgi:hypothetical protein
MASSIADFVVSLGADGQILSQGSIQESIISKEVLAEVAEEDQEAFEKNEEILDAEQKKATATNNDGKLILAEEVAEGHVSWTACKQNSNPSWICVYGFFAVNLFFFALGGNHPVLFWFFYLATLLLAQIVITAQVRKLLKHSTALISII